MFYVNNLSLRYFFVFCLVQIVIAFYSQNYLFTDEFYRIAFTAQMSDRQIEDYIDFSRKWQWLRYAFVPIALLIRITFGWLLLTLASFISGKFSAINLWRLCVQAELIFAIGGVLTLVYFELFAQAQSIEQFSVVPFSLSMLLDSGIPRWSSYLTNTINLFEVGYVLYLGSLLASASGHTYQSSLRFVASGYLPGLAIWIVVVTYLLVVLNP